MQDKASNRKQQGCKASVTLITPEGIVEVDFDIVLVGPTAKEFELGKLFYHLLFQASREQMLAYLEATDAKGSQREAMLETWDRFLSTQGQADLPGRSNLVPTGTLCKWSKSQVAADSSL